MTIALIITIVAWVVAEIKHFFAERRWYNERRELCSRVQAGTLQDYMSCADVRPDAPVTIAPPDVDLPEIPVSSDEYETLSSSVESAIAVRMGI